MAAHQEMISVDELLQESRTFRREVHRGNRRSSSLPTVITDDSDMVRVEIQEDEWLRSVMDDGDEAESKESQMPKIQKVPRMLRENESNRKCYDPLVVSIGPYHHGKPELESMEKRKITMARQYVAGDARECYAEGATERFTDEAFTQMMFLDGCFILQFMYCIVKNKRETMKMKSYDVAFVQRDLFLLENQLPFLVLEELMRLSFIKDDGRAMTIEFIKQARATPPEEDSRIEVAKKFVRKYIWVKQGPSKGKLRGFEGHRMHLLEIFRTEIVRVQALIDCKCSQSSRADWFSYRSAKELKTVGIHFRAGKIRCFSDVKFKSKLCYVFGAVHANNRLLAHRQDAPEDFSITSYICFMDSLIDQAEDVMELRSKGILLNFLGSDQQVADLFNEIANDLVPNPNAYVDVKNGIENHYKNTIKIWIAEWLHNHFTSPWTFLAFFGAILALALSIIQTYYTAFPSGN
ncbi:hypothetical protein L1049_008477 [Liquidambar formosana]|uniref:Uncharacterized protein n=1 Tax=Liquidambar formosana TaxID=63359 RepID=A0AAP0S3P3_LIQFO